MNRLRRSALISLLLLLIHPGSTLAEQAPAYRFNTRWFTRNIPQWEEHLGHLRVTGLVPVNVPLDEVVPDDLRWAYILPRGTSVPRGRMYATNHHPNTQEAACRPSLACR